MEIILVLKVIHIVGFVAWFSGLFYLGRMFVYHTEANELQQPDSDILKRQFELMQQRVYKIICNPAMMITWTAGTMMIFFYGMEWFKANSWLHIKILLLIFLTVYHVMCKKQMLKLASNKMSFSSFQFRLFNEVPTLFLVTIVSLAIFKNSSKPIVYSILVLSLAILIYIFAKIYKKKRENL
jgi:putative membrane protein